MATALHQCSNIKKASENLQCLEDKLSALNNTAAQLYAKGGWLNNLASRVLAIAQAIVSIAAVPFALVASLFASMTALFAHDKKTAQIYAAGFGGIAFGHLFRIPESLFSAIFPSSLVPKPKQGESDDFLEERKLKDEVEGIIPLQRHIQREAVLLYAEGTWCGNIGSRLLSIAQVVFSVAMISFALTASLFAHVFLFSLAPWDRKDGRSLVTGCGSTALINLCKIPESLIGALFPSTLELPNGRVYKNWLEALYAWE